MRLLRRRYAPPRNDRMNLAPRNNAAGKSNGNVFSK